MRKKIRPSQVKGDIQAPPSKSFAQRAIAIAAIADGRSEIMLPGDSDDVNAAINVVKQLGAAVELSGNNLYVTGGIAVPVEPLDCGEAGLSIRMFSAIAAIFDKIVILTGQGSLLKRPMNVVEDSLSALGAQCLTNKGFLPLNIRGPLKGGVAELDGSFSSQVLTGILIAAPYAEHDIKLLVKNLTSRPYIDITIAVMNSFGVRIDNNNYEEFFIKSGQRYHPVKYEVEGDWSAAAFLLVAGAIGGRVRVNNINVNSPQADKAIINALESSGAGISLNEMSVSVNKSNLKAFDFDATHCPDLFPPLVSLAAYCEGETRLRGVNRLIYKESNRALTLKQEFGKLGINISFDEDTMIIRGGRCEGGLVYSHGDHRIAMACAIAALAGKGVVEIEGAGAVAKSYPDFFDDLAKLIVC